MLLGAGKGAGDAAKPVLESRRGETKAEDGTQKSLNGSVPLSECRFVVLVLLRALLAGDERTQ